MAWDVKITDECKAWFEALNEDEQDSIFAVVGILRFSTLVGPIGYFMRSIPVDRPSS